MRNLERLLKEIYEVDEKKSVETLVKTIDEKKHYKRLDEKFKFWVPYELRREKFKK